MVYRPLKSNRQGTTGGFVLIIVLAVLAVLALLGITFVTLSSVEREVSRTYLDEVRAKFIAESGIHFAQAKLSTHLKNTNWFFSQTPESRQWVYWGDVTNESAAGSVPNSKTPIEQARNPSFAYEDEATQNPTDANTTPKLIRVDGQDVGYTGFMESSTYGTQGDVYTLKVTDLTGRIYINDGLGDTVTTANLKRLLETLGVIVGVTDLGNKIVANRPAKGYGSTSDLLKYFSVSEFGKFKDFVTVWAWVDDKVVDPVPLSPSANVINQYAHIPELIASRPTAEAGSRGNLTATDGSNRIYRYGRGRNWDWADWGKGKWVGGGATPTPLEFYDGDLDDVNTVSGSNLANAMIFGWDELNPCYIRKTKRAPVNINTASYEVLISLLDGLDGFYVMERPSDIGGAASADGPAYDWYLTRVAYQFDSSRFKSGDIGIVMRTQPISGPVGAIGEISGGSLAEQIAAAIIANRNKKPDEISKDYEGPFSSWAQFNRFVDSLVKTSANPSGVIEDTTGHFDAIQARFPDCPIKDMASQAMADAVKANFNPNLHLNVINPDASIHTLVDKTELIHWSTEFCFTPMGYVEVVSLGRILKSIGSGTSTISEFREVAQRKVQCVIKLFDAYRDDLQKNFYDGDIKTDPPVPNEDIFGATAVRTNNNRALETGPEPDNGSAPMENEYEGYVTLATVGGDLPLSSTFADARGLDRFHKPKGAVWEGWGTTDRTTSGITDARAYAHYTYDFDLNYAEAARDGGTYDDFRRSLTRLWNQGKASLTTNQFNNANSITAIPPYNTADWSEDATARDASTTRYVSVNRVEATSSNVTVVTNNGANGTGGVSSIAKCSGGQVMYVDPTTGNCGLRFTFTGTGVVWYAYQPKYISIVGGSPGSVTAYGKRIKAAVYLYKTSVGRGPGLTDFSGMVVAQPLWNTGDGIFQVYARTGLPYDTYTMDIWALPDDAGWDSYASVDYYEVLTNMTMTPGKGTPRIGPYCYVDSPGVTPFLSSAQTSRYRLCRTYVSPPVGQTSADVPVPVYAPADLRTDGAYVERNCGIPYWPGRKDSLEDRYLWNTATSTDDYGEANNFYIKEGGISYWVKPSYYPETAGKIRGYVNSIRRHNADSKVWIRNTPFGHWFMPAQLQSDASIINATPTGGRMGSTARTFNFGYSLSAWGYTGIDFAYDPSRYNPGPPAVFLAPPGSFFYYPGYEMWGGLVAPSMNHVGHTMDESPNSIGNNPLKAHKWTHVTMLWNMHDSANTGANSVGMMINGQRPGYQVSYSTTVGYQIVDPYGGSTGSTVRNVWNLSDGVHQDGNRYWPNPLRLGDVSLSRTGSVGPEGQTNYTPDSTIDEFSVWHRRGDVNTAGSGTRGGTQQFQLGRYYRGNNGVFTSAKINLGTQVVRQLPNPSGIPAPDGSLPSSSVGSLSGGVLKVLGVAWTMMSEDYRFTNDGNNPLGYLMYDYQPQAVTYGAGPKDPPMVPQFKVRVSDGDVVPAWSVDPSGNPAHVVPGWSSVRSPSNPNDNLTVKNFAAVQYRVKFEITGLNMDSILLATPVLDDVTLFYSTGLEILEYQVL